APPRRLRREVPGDLETICLKCLEKDPRRRYASARALADDLNCYLSGRPIAARPVPAWERAIKWASRQPFRLVAEAALAAALLLGLLPLLWTSAETSRRLDEQLARQESELERLREGLRRAEQERDAVLLERDELRLALERARATVRGPAPPPAAAHPPGAAPPPAAAPAPREKA